MTDQTEAMDAPSAKSASLPGYVLHAALDVWGQAGGQHLISITGGSMLPLIRSGDYMLVAHGCAGVRRGDVIVFRREGTLVAHRVLRVRSDDVGPMFVTKGDNSSQFDPPLSADDIVGRVLAIERSGRHMSLDTVAWRMVGWLIAVGTLAWVRLYGWSRALKRRFLGPQPNRVTAFLRRSALTFFSLVLKAVQALVCRWEDNGLSASASRLSSSQAQDEASVRGLG